MSTTAVAVTTRCDGCIDAHVRRAKAAGATKEEMAEARMLFQKTPPGTFGALFDRWARAVEEGAKSLTPRLLYEMALVDLCHAEPLLPLGDLLERLEVLEGRLGSGAPPPPGPRWRNIPPRAMVFAGPASIRRVQQSILRSTGGARFGKPSRRFRSCEP